MRSRPVIILILLLLVLGAGGYLAFMSGSDEPKPVPVAQKAQARAVMAFAGALPPGHIIGTEDLKRVPWPADPIPPAAILDGTPEAERLSGSVTRRAFAAGEFVVRDATVAPGERGFLAAIVSPGYRAFGVRVDAESGASGLIWPGDRVDIILTQEIRQDGVPITQSVVGETVISDVRVLSADQRLENAKPTSGGDLADRGADSAPPRVPATVTVEVLPRDAERLAVAATLGRLHLVLRSVASGNEVSAGPPTFAGAVSRGLVQVRTETRQLSGPSTAPAVALPPRTVRVYRGSGAQG